MTKFRLFARLYNNGKIIRMNYKKSLLTKTELKKAICETVDGFESSKDVHIDIIIGKEKNGND